MDRVRVELVGPLLIEEQRRGAERERLLIALERSTWHGAQPLTRLGGLLIQAGVRLQAVGAPRATPRPLLIATDPCGGCAN